MSSKVMVSFPEEFLAQVDQVAREEHRSRSELLREAMRLYMERRQNQNTACRRDDPNIQRALATMEEIARQSPGTGEDSTGAIRRWRDSRYGPGYWTEGKRE